PVASYVHYDFPARGNLPPLKLHWYDGGIMPPRPDELEEPRELKRDDGIIFIGDQGKMLVEGWGGEFPRILPESPNKQYRRRPTPCTSRAARITWCLPPAPPALRPAPISSLPGC